MALLGFCCACGALCGAGRAVYTAADVARQQRLKAPGDASTIGIRFPLVFLFYV
jgi:hypothetical protein